jgi:hypothetical protein
MASPHRSYVYEFYSETLGAMSHTMDGLKSITEANQVEVSRKLGALYDELVLARQEMAAASEDRVATLFETMMKNTLRFTEEYTLRFKVETILQSLTFDKIVDRESNIPRAHQSTFEWALSEADLMTTLPDWLRSGRGVYWVEGKAGSGKSTLMKFLQQESRTRSLLEEWADGRHLAMVSHYFWAPGTEMQRSLLGLFRTLLFQIFLQEPRLIKQICGSRMYQEYGYMQPWTLQELESCFEAFSEIQDLSWRFCFFIDGLDEFEGDHERLIDIIRSISKSTNIKICVASRPWIPFQNAYGSSPQKLSVHEFTKADIRKYAQDELTRSTHYQKLQVQSLDQAASLIREISDAADGVFLWVYLVVRDLRRGLSNNDDLATLRRRLQDMPRDLHSFFERMLNSIDQVYWVEARSLLSILAYTQLSLSTLLTWAHRESRVSSLADIMVDFSPHKRTDSVTRKADEWWYHWIFQEPADEERIRTWAEGYDAELEKQRIVARCGDLVHVAAEGIPLSESDDRLAHRVVFLHRTVAEFIGPALKSRFDQNRAIASVGRSLIPIVALFDAYMALISSQILPRSSPVLVTYQKWMLCLALEAKQHAPSAYLHLIHSYCATLSMINGEPDSLSLDLLVGAAMASNTAAEECQCDGSTVRSVWETCFWVLHCRDCRANYLGVPPQLMGAVMRKPKVPSLLADGRVQEEELPEVNLGVVEALLRAWQPRADSASWCSSLEDLSRKGARHAPANMQEVCRIIIQIAAERFGNDAETPNHLRRIPAIQKADPTGKLVEREFRFAAGKARSARNPMEVYASDDEDV